MKSFIREESINFYVNVDEKASNFVQTEGNNSFEKKFE